MNPRNVNVDRQGPEIEETAAGVNGSGFGSSGGVAGGNEGAGGGDEDDGGRGVSKQPRDMTFAEFLGAVWQTKGRALLSHRFFERMSSRDACELWIH